MVGTEVVTVATDRQKLDRRELAHHDGTKRAGHEYAVPGHDLGAGHATNDDGIFHGERSFPWG